MYVAFTGVLSTVSLQDMVQSVKCQVGQDRGNVQGHEWAIWGVALVYPVDRARWAGHGHRDDRRLTRKAGLAGLLLFGSYPGPWRKLPNV